MSWWLPEKPKRLFHDRQWKRADLAAWDAKWQRLSAEARGHYLNDFKAIRPQAKTPRALMASLPDPIRDELEKAGFAVVRRMPKGGELHPRDEAKAFNDRLRALVRYKLLDHGSGLRNYVSHVFDSYGLSDVVTKITLEATGIGRYDLPGDPLDLFVPGPRWAGWVLDHIKQPLARELADALRQAGGRHPAARLGELVPGASPEPLRAAYDALVNHLVLVEDLDPHSHEIIAGYLPSVRAAWAAAAGAKAELAPVTPVVAYAEVGPMVADLRAVLLEMSGGPVQLKQDGYLFAKEEERMYGTLPERPGGDADAEEDSPARVNAAFVYASKMGLMERKARAGKRFVELRPQAADWLRAGVEKQHAELFALFQAPPSEKWGYEAPGDSALLGTTMKAIPKKAGQKIDNPRRKYDFAPVRKALQEAFESLPEGKFYPVEALLRHLSEPERNPFLLGRPLAEVALFLDERAVMPLEEVVAESTRRALADLLRERLVPLGCLRQGQDSAGGPLVARLPRLSRYFDGSPPPAEATASAECRVIVQPDFSVIVIGLNPGPAAELAQFAARDRSANTPGAVIFRLVREEVFRGLMAGLTGEKMVDALQRLSSTPVPANIMTQVLDWAAQGRVATTAPMLVIRCPDPGTADRVMGALSKQAERLGPQSVGLPEGKLPAALRQKLLAQGVMVRD